MRSYKEIMLPAVAKEIDDNSFKPWTFVLYLLLSPFISFYLPLFPFISLYLPFFLSISLTSLSSQ